MTFASSSSFSSISPISSLSHVARSSLSLQEVQQRAPAVFAEQAAETTGP